MFSCKKVAPFLMIQSCFLQSSSSKHQIKFDKLELPSLYDQTWHSPSAELTTAELVATYMKKKGRFSITNSFELWVINVFFCLFFLQVLMRIQPKVRDPHFLVSWVWKMQKKHGRSLSKHKAISLLCSLKTSRDWLAENQVWNFSQ